MATQTKHKPITVHTLDAKLDVTTDTCPRCGERHALAKDKDYNGWYVECIHCGYLKDL